MRTLACAAFVLIGVATAPLQAQMKLDPRLGAMRSVWIEAEDELSAAPAVAACFEVGIKERLPLAVAAEKNLSQVVFKFRPVEQRIELTVFMHDNQQLWSGSARAATVTIPSPRTACATALALIEQLRTAMRSARDGLWYQSPNDPIEAAATPVVPTSSQSARPPRAENTSTVMSASYQVTEVNRVFWRFSWKMSIRNYGQEAIVVSPAMEFQNRSGFIVDSGIESTTDIRPQDTVEITGTTLIKADIAPSVAKAVGKAQRIR